MKSRVHHYRAHGLHIRSGIEVPFAVSGAAAEPDLRIRAGAVPERLSAATHGGGWQAAPGLALLNVEGVARYLIRNRGAEVIVAAANGADGNVGAYLLGAVLGGCLHQRGRLVLHASAVETDRGAVLFVGDSGAGKSTLLAALLDRGYRALTDEVAGIALDADGRPEVFGAFPCVRLWADDMERLGWNGDRRVLEDVRGSRRKWRVHVERFREAPLTVRTVFEISTHDEDGIVIEPLAPTAGLTRLARHTYCRRLVPALGLEHAHFRMLAATARHAQVIRVTRPEAAFQIAALTDRILGVLGEPERNAD